MIIANLRMVFSTRNVLPAQRNLLFLKRVIGTSAKDASASVAADVDSKSEVKRKKKPTPWITYGFDVVDQRNDLFWLHVISGSLITLFFWGHIFFYAYYPDMENVDWIHREAYIELRRREVLGLPLVDKNYVDPATINLPPDEEIGDYDIII